MRLNHFYEITRDVKVGWLAEPVRSSLLDVKPEALDTTVLPLSDTLRSLKYFQPHETRAIVLGQDPYHTPGKANGLAFGVRPDFKRSVRDSLDAVLLESRATDGSLESWSKQGALLLNTILSVERGRALSHQALGWQYVIHKILSLIPPASVFLLWGKHAKALYDSLDIDNPYIYTSHPSPFSAHVGSRPFTGSNCFAKANGLLITGGLEPINWSITNKEAKNEDLHQRAIAPSES